MGRQAIGTYTISAEPLRLLRPWRPLPDRKLRFHLLVYLFNHRFEDSEYAIKLEDEFRLGGVDFSVSEITYILLLHINDQRPAAKIANGKELDILVPSELLGCLRSVRSFRR